MAAELQLRLQKLHLLHLLQFLPLTDNFIKNFFVKEALHIFFLSEKSVRGGNCNFCNFCNPVIFHDFICNDSQLIIEIIILTKNNDIHIHKQLPIENR